ncbi:6,7-dimethyl-8-ribityllumazine synthase [bacterium]|jgi:6,7-dimethyl-8-ribityllumazine synthase|nr:6,7-dimethyl-8-ribityllumazine synthase [bacterium]MBR4465096.1 6,7-dimethyl-8-ribityllumazine synthase [bacterium]MBR4820603.1 6,7-dimethyl-8-ribityllumazine synthase [bacterium]
MYKKLEGMLNAEGKRLGVVVSRFNEIITGKLLEGALDCWRRHGGKEEDVTVVFVPGAWEIPPTAMKLAKSGKVDAVVCLGAVIRGATPHFEFVAAESAKGIAQASMQQTEVPMTFGVLTCDTIEQAVERAGSKSGNKGWDATLSAIEMLGIYKQL